LFAMTSVRPHSRAPRDLHSFPTRRSSDLASRRSRTGTVGRASPDVPMVCTGSALRLSLGRMTKSGASRQSGGGGGAGADVSGVRSEEHTSELQSRENLVCRLLLEKKKQDN